MRALIVGGSKGLGKDYGIYLIERGLHVTNCSRSTAKYGCDNIFIDLSEVTPELCERKFHNIQTFDACFFFSRARGTNLTLTEELTVNVTGTFELLEFLAFHCLSKGSRVVFVSSVNSKYINLKVSLGYHLSKGALVSGIKYYAVKLATLEIAVNAISPSTVRRNGFLQYEAYGEASPLKRMCLPIDLFTALDFFGFNCPGYLTGQDILLDGSISNVWREPNVFY